MGWPGTVFILVGAALVAVAESRSSSRKVDDGEIKEESSTDWWTITSDWSTRYTDPTTTAKAECPLPFIDISGRCIYVNSLESGTWAQVENLCVMLHGALVKIDTGLFLSDLVAYIEGFGLDGDFWTGGTDTAIEGEWTWLDGTPVHMGTPFWGYYPSEPIVQQPTYNTAANCLCLRDHYLYFFMDCNCESSYAPICEYDAGQGKGASQAV